MPKKFTGESNPKVIAARERKVAVKKAETERKQKQIEDEYWRDNDKQIVKKQQKKEEQEKKKQEALQKKAEAKAQLEKELQSIKGTVKSQPLPKVTRSEIALQLEKKKAAAQVVTKPSKPDHVSHLDVPLEENINRLEVEGEEARTVDEAIAVLSLKDDLSVDRHPEKRLKAAFAAFESMNLPRLKEENPTLRLSQLKQLLRKEWEKSPANPLNQAK